MKPRCLFAGPWVGEFGHELFNWQGLLRSAAREYDRVVVASRRGHGVLYEDFASEYVEFESNAEDCSYAANSAVRPEKCNIPEMFSLPPDCDVILPSRIPRCQPVYARYGHAGAHGGYDIVLHVRQILGKSKSRRNWPLARWEELLPRLREMTASICCIGRSTGAACLDRVADERDVPLGRLADILANSRLVIGTSSGPMHFASLCGCPHVVWTGEPYVAHRYRKAWNPFNTPELTLLMDDAKADDVKDAVRRIVDQHDIALGRAGGGAGMDSPKPPVILADASAASASVPRRYDFSHWPRLPRVSCQCITYGRPHLLNEAVESFLRQDYEGEKELVILNDHPEVLIEESDLPEVRVFNVGRRFHSIGEKRNACCGLCAGEIIFPWDDDDISLPWRISLTLQRMTNLHYLKPDGLWYWANGTISHRKAVAHAMGAWSRGLFDEVGGYPHIQSGQDQAIEALFAKTGRRMVVPCDAGDLFYIYRFPGTGSYHLSASGYGKGLESAEEFVARNVPAGRYAIRPQWREDYVALVPVPVRTKELTNG